MKNLPKTLFVKIEKDGLTEYFVADTKAEFLIEMGDTVRIGKYSLVELSDAKGVAAIMPPKKRRA